MQSHPTLTLSKVAVLDGVRQASRAQGEAGQGRGADRETPQDLQDRERERLAGLDATVRGLREMG
ncbi:hypothetical protein KIPB_014897, partial [Kipferlia bialata]|eukprot:g14897.t1